MLAVIAAILFVIGAVKAGTSSVEFWLLLGLAAWALHFAFDLGFDALRTRRR